MLIEMHMLKNYPATNLNRDETGAPKTCEFGGVTRGRISSQCLKRSWRSSELFKSLVGEENLGTRTRKLPVKIIERLREDGVSEEYLEALTPIISGFGNKEGKPYKNDPTKTAQIMFYSEKDFDAVYEIVSEEVKKCKTVKEVSKIKALDLQKKLKDAKTRPISVDIALFGRMVTSNSFRDVEASIQVAHAVSTNRVVLESDYYTAMDDLLFGETMEDNGSGMIGDIDYDSSCYYMYSSLDIDAFKDNLSYADNVDGLVRVSVSALLQTMALTNPSAKQNSFAGNVLPSAILVEVKDKKIPVSYVNAFVEPVNSRKIVEDSIKKLVGESDMISRNFNLPVTNKFWFCVDKYAVDAPKDAVKCATFNELVENVENCLK